VSLFVKNFVSIAATVLRAVCWISLLWITRSMEGLDFLLHLPVTYKRRLQLKDPYSPCLTAG
jgi:hypothetical protein